MRSGSSEERVVLVDETDQELGTEAKLAAHVLGALHRAVSVCVFDRRRRVLLQRRAESKYHSAGLWSNTCCTHPHPGESPKAAAHRRLAQEMGFDCPLRPVSTVRYRHALGNGLVEHEYDHVFVGRFDGAPAPSPHEVAEWRWADPDEVLADLAANPDRYTAWCGLVLESAAAMREM
jgi:isopentenyl-diphosphate delta-isomerase